MAFQSDSTLDAILAKTDLIELINETVPLQKKGKNHFGLCPFHNEKTPSFSVNEENQLYHCFSCKASGNAITFVKETKGYSSAQAIKFLADRSGITIDEQRYIHPQQKFFDINEQALNYFKLMLNHTDEGLEAREYLQSRGMIGETLATFNVGLATVAKDALYRAMVKQALLLSDLTDLGLVHGGDDPYDVFRNRIIFPLHDEDGRVVGFSGRRFGKNEQDAVKYINTTATPIFQKGHILYNLHRAKKAIKETGRIVIFEGFMDVIMAHQAGVKESVAVMGTALTEHHIRLIKKLTHRVVLCFDGDQAGKEATNKFLEDLHRASLETSVVALRDGLDPDDVINKDGAKAFRRLIDEAPGRLDYLYNDYKTLINPKRITEIEQFKKRVFVLIENLSNTEQTHYLNRLAEDFSLSIESLMQDFQAIRRKSLPQYKKIPHVEITDKFKKVERHLIHYFFKDRYYEKKFRSEFHDALFNDKHARDIQLEIFEYYRLNKGDLSLVPDLFIHHLSSAQKAYYQRYIKHPAYPYDETEFEDFLSVMREQKKRIEIKRLQDKITTSDLIEEKIRYRKAIDALIKESKHGKRKNHSRID